MHEIGLCEGLLEAVERRARGRRVTVVQVRAGALQRVVGESMDTAFELVAAGSVAAGARVDLVVVPVRVHCRACGRDTESVDVFARCGSCGSDDLDLTGGDELTLESISLATGPEAGARAESAGLEDEKELRHVSRHPG